MPVGTSVYFLYFTFHMIILSSSEDNELETCYFSHKRFKFLSKNCIVLLYFLKFARNVSSSFSKA